MRRFDVTPFCWQLVRSRPERLRLILYTAPGWTPEVSYRLQNQRVKTIERGRTLRVEQAASLARLLPHLCPQFNVQELIEHYESLFPKGQRGHVIPAEVRAERVRVVKAILARIPRVSSRGLRTRVDELKAECRRGEEVQG